MELEIIQNVKNKLSDIIYSLDTGELDNINNIVKELNEKLDNYENDYHKYRIEELRGKIEKADDVDIKVGLTMMIIEEKKKIKDDINN